MGWIEWFVVKNSETTSWHELLHHFGPFCTQFCRQPNGSKYIQIVRNTQKHEFRVQWGGSGAFIAKKSDTTSLHELLHHFSPFCTEFCMATKRSQMQPNSIKHNKTCVSSPMGWIGCVRCEKFRRDIMARTFA